MAQLLVLLGAARWRGLDIPMSKMAGSLVPGPGAVKQATCGAAKYASML
ncbi:hypothetical protein K1Y80_51400 [Streptomyces sp. MAG02]|nr:hypothetical protein [Streptomyces sp. MAG02]